MFKLMEEKREDEVKLATLRCLAVVFAREPHLIIKAIDRGQSVQALIDAVRDSDPEMALEGILFWEHFVMLESVTY